MKATGIVRTVDELGRVVLPKSMRKQLEIEDRDSVEIFTEGNRIILQKHQPACIFCGRNEEILFFQGKRVCAPCMRAMRQMLE